MIETGQIALYITLPAAVVSAVISSLGAVKGWGRTAAWARSVVFVVFGLYTLSFAVLLYAFLSGDFSVRIVAEHASRDLPSVYALSALYADKGGSLFFWGWLVSLFAALLALRKQDESRSIVLYAQAVLAVLIAFYLALVTYSADIFGRYPSAPPDGYGLNPLLQNFGMLVHPPMLYLGFAGFAVVFALVIGAYIAGSPGTWPVRLIRRWTLFAWCALGIGNLLGMWWSYNELGWGGYWAWDPVENAGLMPWLLGTAFLHSLVMLRQRSYLRVWGYCLIVFTFTFTLLSPFITHGGIESPLHGFYGSPLPPYLLAAMLIAVIGSLLLLFLRRRGIAGDEQPISWVSREGSFLLTNIVLVLLVAVIFAGTVLPRLVELFGGTKVAVDRGFFDRTCGPIMLILVFLMGVCPLLGWGKTAWRSARRTVLFAAIIIVLAVAAILISGAGNWYIAVVIVCGVALFVIIREWCRGAAARRRSSGKGIFRSFFSLISGNRARYGGFLAHIGIVLVALGIIVSSFYSVEKTVTLDVGDSVRAGSYEVTYSDLLFRQDNAKVSAVATMEVNDSGRPVAVMRPSYAFWFSAQDYFSEVAVRTTAAEDLFISLVWTGFDPDDRTATFRVLVNPLIVWIWAGGAFFLGGGVLAFTFRESLTAGGER